MRHLDVVVSRDASLDVHDPSANLRSFSLNNVSLLLIRFPVAKWLHFEVLKDIDERVLPDCLNDGYIGGSSRLVCSLLSGVRCIRLVRLHSSSKCLRCTSWDG